MKAANKIMSGLDGLGWPNPEDEPKPKKTMNSQLEIKLAPTPESDKAKIAFTSLFANDDAYWIPYAIGKKLERERDQFSKTLGEVREILCDALPNENQLTSFMAATLVRKLTVVTKQRDQLEERLRVELGGHPDSELWGDAGLIAATMRCVDALVVVTEQRDRLAAALGGACDNPTTGNWYREARDALSAWKEVRSES